MPYTHPLKLQVVLNPLPQAQGSFTVPPVTPSLKNSPYLYVHTLNGICLYVGEAATLNRVKHGFRYRLGLSSAYGWRANYPSQTLLTYAFKLPESVFEIGDSTGSPEEFRKALEAEVVAGIRARFGNWPRECHGIQPQPQLALNRTVLNRRDKVLNQLFGAAVPRITSV